MNTIEDKLNHAADATRNEIDHVPDRSGAFVAARHRRQRAGYGILTATVALVLVVGTTMLVAQANNDEFAGTGQVQTPSVSTTAAPLVPAPVQTDVTTTIITQTESSESGEGSRFSTRTDDELGWQWATQAAASDWGPIALEGEVGKLAAVRESVPELAESTVLAFSSTEFSESAFFLLGDGSDTVVYIGWQEYDDELLIDTPVLDETFNVGMTDDYLVAHRLLTFTGDFVVDAGSEIATVRFFQLDDGYAHLRLEMSSDNMSRLVDGVLPVLGLPDDAPGDLLDNAGPTPTQSLPTAAPVDLVTTEVTLGSVPEIVSCGVPGSSQTTPNRSGDIVNGATQPTPEAALWSFLRDSALDKDRQGLAASGYVQTTLPNSTVVFSKPFDGAASLSVTNITVEQSTSGWVATSWEGSGC